MSAKQQFWSLSQVDQQQKQCVVQRGRTGALAENRVHCQLDFRLRFLNRFWNVDMKQLKEPYFQPLKEETSIHKLKSIAGPQVMGSFVCRAQKFLVQEGQNT